MLLIHNGRKPNHAIHAIAIVVRTAVLREFATNFLRIGLN